jgi:hypothetical protein
VIRFVVSVVAPSLRVRHFVSVLLISTPLFATTDIPKTKASVCGLTAVEAARLNVDPSADVRALSDYRKGIYLLLKSRRFDQLDCLADSARSQREMFPGGIWKLHTMYLGLQTPPLHPTQQDWNRHMSLVREWVSAKPKSITARIALAESYVSYGWDARGNGFSDSVSNSGWKLFDQRVSQAVQVLKGARGLPKKCPEGYVAMQQVALAQGWRPNTKKALLEEAVQFEPAYYYYYRGYATSILPKWDGHEGDAEQFLKIAADHVAGDAGDILYFQVAAYLACCQTDEQLKLSWPRIQKGFRALERASGPALENTNYLARLASIYQDPLVANRMFIRIGEQWSEEIWRTSTYFESVKQWATQMSSTMQKQNQEEEAAEANLLTVEGQRYKAAIDRTIESVIPECIKENGVQTGNFEMLFHIQKDGMIGTVTTVGINRVGFCVMQKIQTTGSQNRAAFPPPPKPDYWVRYDLLPENFPSQAMK